MKADLTQREREAQRTEEYDALMKQLEELPVQLDYVEARLQARVASKKKRWQKFIAIPTGSLCACIILFVLLVNSTPAFARAMGNIPVLRTLAKFVAFSPSLVAAIDNDFVQQIEESQTKGTITAHIAYLIVDQKQVNVFYTLSSDQYTALEATPEIRQRDGTALEGYGMSSSYGAGDDGLRQITIDFIDNDVPSGLKLDLRIHDNGAWQKEESVLFDEDGEWLEEVHEAPEALVTFEFDLVFDPYFTAQGEVLSVDTAFQIEGQSFTLEEAHIYPTHMRFNLEDTPQNTAYLVGMDYYIVNEKGKVFDRIKNGVSASGKVDSPMMASYRLESAFFSESKELMLYITEVAWLDKAHERVVIDLQSLEADTLPDGVSLETATQHSWGWEVVFSGTTDTPDSSYGMWQHHYYDEEGNTYFINSQSFSTGYWDDVLEMDVGEANKFYNTIPLVDFTESVVYMAPAFTRKVVLEEPICLRIK